MLHAFNYFNSNVHSFFPCVLQLMEGVACIQLCCAFYKQVGLESPKKELIEVFCLSSATHNLFKQKDLKIATSCFLLSSDRHSCQGSCTHVQPSSRALIVPGPPPSPSQLSALSCELSPELCCACACLQSSGWILLSGLLVLGWLKDSGRSIFLLSPTFTGPTAVTFLWHLAASKQHHGSSEFQIPLCFLHQVCPSAPWVSLQLSSLLCAGNVLQEAGGAAWRKTPLWPLLAWFGGSSVTSRAGRSILIRVNLGRVDWKEKPSFLSKQQLCSCTPRRECLPWL